jgi:polysaccharide biosynthesis protein PslE
MATYSDFVYSSAREVFYVIFRHKWKIILVFLLTVALVTLVTFMLPETYESRAGLLLRFGKENLPAVLDDEVTTLVDVTNDRTNELNAVMAVLTSYELAEQVVDAIGEGWILDRPDLRFEPLEIEKPDYDHPIKQLSRMGKKLMKTVLITLRLREELTTHQEAIKTVMDNFQTRVEKQNNVINLVYEAGYGPIAKAVLDHYITFYKKKHIEIFSDSMPQPEFYRTQAENLKKELTEWENTVDAYRKENRLANIERQKNVLIDRISELEAELNSVKAEARGLKAMVDTLDATARKLPRTHELARTSGLPNMAVNDYKETLKELKLEEKDLASRFPDTHRPLARLRKQIADVGRMLAGEREYRTEVTVGIDANREDLINRFQQETANYNAVLARITGLEEELVKDKEELDQVASHEMTLLQLERERDLVEKEYREYINNLQRSVISKTMDDADYSNITVAQQASAPLDPVRPNKVRNVALGILLGLFGGIAFAFLMEFLDDTLNTIEDAERKLGVPVLASMSEKDYKACI